MLCIILLFSLKGFGQSNLNKKVILPGTSHVQLDSGYAVDANSIYFASARKKIIQPAYHFNAANGGLLLDSISQDTLLVFYRTLPSLFSKPYLKKSTALIEQVMPKDPFANTGPKNILFGNQNALKTDGNISRGISVGNKQDLVVNSNLNLRLGGKIADDINITGAISDDNNPIQPEGNTQQLQDFDKVYILLNKDSNNLLNGDFEMKRPDCYFMNYYKKSRGLHNDFQLAKNKVVSSSNIDAAISRGRFARNVIQGL